MCLVTRGTCLSRCCEATKDREQPAQPVVGMLGSCLLGAPPPARQCVAHIPSAPLALARHATPATGHKWQSSPLFLKGPGVSEQRGPCKAQVEPFRDASEIALAVKTEN